MIFSKLLHIVQEIFCWYVQLWCMEFKMELQKYFGPIALLLSKTSSSEHYLKLFTIGVCEQAGLKIGCWESPKSPHCTVYSLTSRTVGQIPKKCKETSNLIWLSLIRIKCVTKTKNVSVLFRKNLKPSFLHDSNIWLWGFFVLLVALAHGELPVCRRRATKRMPTSALLFNSPLCSWQLL